MDETRSIIERLERIEQLRGEQAPAEVMLEELRALLGEAEEWARLEGGEAGDRAVARLRSALAGAPPVTAESRR